MIGYGLREITDFSEINRLFLVFLRLKTEKLEKLALIENCEQSAGAISRYPSPKTAIEVALSLSLLTDKKKHLCISELGRIYVKDMVPDQFQLLAKQRHLLLSIIVDSVCADDLLQFLANFYQVEGVFMVKKTRISENSVWCYYSRLFQNLGAVVVAGDYLKIDADASIVLERWLCVGARLSQEQLLVRLEQQRIRGEMAEEVMVSFEKHRLISLGHDTLASKVRRISKDDVSAGFDIISFEPDGTPRFIEVKSSTGSRLNFEWSTGERYKAKQEQMRYFIYFVPLSYSLPKMQIEPILIENPVRWIEEGRLHERATSYNVIGAASNYKLF